MLGATDSLKQGGDGARRAELANEVNRADVDSQLERCRSHKRSKVTALQAVFGIETQLGGKAAMMRRDRVRAE